jgi:(p)ppGpp synthase/HD superfamily hydrolase
VLTERFHKALVFAAELHADQRRKGDDRTPYIAHLLSVCALVLENGGDEDEAIAALLHDAIEDQGGAPTCEAIRGAFGDRVAAIVIACSDTDETPKPPWRQRKEAYLAHLPEATPSARLVSAADKLHNARSILHDYRAVGEAIWGRFRGGKEGSLWYYRSLVTIYSQVGPSGLAGQLERVVAEIEALAS